MTFEPYSLSVGAGTLALSPLPEAAWQVADWDAVLSMTTASEMPDGLVTDFQRRELWAHFPVTDYGVPDDDTPWAPISVQLHDVLEGGGRVLVHCKGGCGRSGMAVLRLMIEAGEDPDKALVRLRSLRPCAVETEAQLAWARG